MHQGSDSCSPPYESNNESHLPALRSGFGAGLRTPCQPALPCCASAQPPFVDLLSRSSFWPCAHGPQHPFSAGPVPVLCKVHAETGSEFTPHQTSLAPAEGLHRRASETTMSAIALHSYASQLQMRGCEQAFTIGCHVTSTLLSSLTSLAMFAVACLCLCSSSLMTFFSVAICIHAVYQICSMLYPLLAALTCSKT